MKAKELGATGVQIPEIGIGTYNYNGGPELIREAVNLGATLIDTAEHYCNEETVGQAIRGHRDRVFVATKVKHWRRSQVLACANASLRRLGIETIDLYQIHWPNAAVPIEETMSAMEELVEQGKIRFIGVSNFTLPELKRAQRALRKHRIVSNQVKYSVIDRTIEPRLLPYCREHRITLIAFSPLGHRYESLLRSDRKGALQSVAEASGKTVAQVSLNWCISHPDVVTIPKTTSRDHLAENCASSDWRLSVDQQARLDREVSFRCRSVAEQATRRWVRGAMQRWHEFKRSIVN